MTLLIVKRVSVYSIPPLFPIHMHTHTHTLSGDKPKSRSPARGLDDSNSMEISAKHEVHAIV